MSERKLAVQVQLKGNVASIFAEAAGDEVLLLGGRGEDGVPCEWLYGPLGLGPSAITCNVRARVPRIFQGAGASCLNSGKAAEG